MSLVKKCSFAQLFQKSIPNFRRPAISRNEHRSLCYYYYHYYPRNRGEREGHNALSLFTPCYGRWCEGRLRGLQKRREGEREFANHPLHLRPLNIRILGVADRDLQQQPCCPPHHPLLTIPHIGRWRFRKVRFTLEQTKVDRRRGCGRGVDIGLG